jgi:hypothetical protein
VIKALCTLENDSPVVITTNNPPSKCSLLEAIEQEQNVEIDRCILSYSTKTNKCKNTITRAP